MLRKYKVELTKVSDEEIKITYTLKNRVQFSEKMSREKAIERKILKPKGSGYGLSQKVDPDTKMLLKYGDFLYRIFGRESARKYLSEFVNLNII